MARYVCLLLSVATLSCGGADRVRVIKLAHGLPISHPVHEAMVFLSERTWEASEGKIRIDVHPAEQLGTERECLELLQIGAVGMTKVSASVLENFVPRYAVFSLPYLFRDEAHRQKVFHGAIGKRILSAGAGLDRFTLLAIPFFILSGQLMNRGGMARRLIDLARGVVGMLPGGLAYVNIVAGMLFGAISGSAVAAVAAVGGFMVPRMREQGYDESFSAAVNVSSATTSLVIPPSNILIVYALAAGGVSIAALFVAGYVPGLLVGLLLMVVAGTIAKRRGYPVDARVGARELARRFFAALPSLFLVVVVMGGIIAGYFTATEAGAVAVLYSFILAVVVYREVATREIPKVLVEASTTTAIVLLLVGTSMAFSWVLAYERIPELIVSAFSLMHMWTWSDIKWPSRIQALFLFRQLMENLSEMGSDCTIHLLPSVLRDEHNVIFAVPSCVG